MVQRLEDPKELLSKFVEAFGKVMEEIKEAEELAKKLKQTDRTLIHHYNKIIQKWFYSNGGM